MSFTYANYIVGNTDHPESHTAEYRQNLLPHGSESMDATYDPWTHNTLGDGTAVYNSNKYSVTCTVTSSGRSYHQLLVDTVAGTFYRLSVDVSALSGTPTQKMISSNATRTSGSGSALTTENGRISCTFEASATQSGTQFRIGFGCLVTETATVSAVFSNWMIEEVDSLTGVCSRWFPAGSIAPFKNARACTVTSSASLITDVTGATLAPPQQIMGAAITDSWGDGVTPAGGLELEWPSYFGDATRGLCVLVNPRPSLGLSELVGAQTVQYSGLIDNTNMPSDMILPTFAILQAGTNDLADGLAAIQGYFNTWLSVAGVPKKFICTIPPSNQTTNEATRISVNNWLLSTLSKLPGVYVVDIAKPLQDPTDASVLLTAYEDGATNHPNAAGSKIVGEVIAGAVSAGINGAAGGSSNMKMSL